MAGRSPSAGSTRAKVDDRPRHVLLVSRYDIRHVEIHPAALKHGITEPDIRHAADHAVVAAEDEDGKCLYLGPDQAGNLLEVVSVMREDAEELVIHAMRMRRMYEPLLREGDT